MSNGASCGEVFLRVCVNFTRFGGAGKDGFVARGSEDGFWGFKMAEVIGSVEEILGAISEFIVVEVKALFFGKVFFRSHDEVNSTARFCSEEVVDAGSASVAGEVEELEGFLDTVSYTHLTLPTIYSV